MTRVECLMSSLHLGRLLSCKLDILLHVVIELLHRALRKFVFVDALLVQVVLQDVWLHIRKQFVELIVLAEAVLSTVTFVFLDSVVHL